MSNALLSVVTEAEVDLAAEFLGKTNASDKIRIIVVHAPMYPSYDSGFTYYQ
jgi:hypothetical protein